MQWEMLGVCLQGINFQGNWLEGATSKTLMSISFKGFSNKGLILQGGQLVEQIGRP